MYFNKHKHRNQTNRNTILIAIGFLATVLAGAFVFQIYVGTISEAKTTQILVSVDNGAKFEDIPYTIQISDTLISRNLSPGIEQFLCVVPQKERIPVHITICDTILLRDTLVVRDTISYVFLQIVSSDSDLIHPNMTVSK